MSTWRPSIGSPCPSVAVAYTVRVTVVCVVAVTRTETDRVATSGPTPAPWAIDQMTFARSFAVRIRTSRVIVVTVVLSTVVFAVNDLYSAGNRAREYAAAAIAAVRTFPIRVTVRLVLCQAGASLGARVRRPTRCSYARCASILPVPA